MRAVPAAALATAIRETALTGAAWTTTAAKLDDT